MSKEISIQTCAINAWQLCTQELESVFTMKRPTLEPSKLLHKIRTRKLFLYLLVDSSVGCCCHLLHG